MTHLALVIFVLLAAGALLRWAAQRHAREQQRRGRWNAEGPLEPTQPPEDEKTRHLRRVTGKNWPPL